MKKLTVDLISYPFKPGTSKEHTRYGYMVKEGRVWNTLLGKGSKYVKVKKEHCKLYSTVTKAFKNATATRLKGGG